MQLVRAVLPATTLILSSMFVLAATAGTTAQRRPAPTLESCAQTEPGPGAKALAAFDAELRSAITNRDLAALAALIAFPLRVNFESGAISLLDAPALRSRFDDVFSKRVRSAMAVQKPEDLVCPQLGGVGYANGAVWVHVVGTPPHARYAVTTVNPEPDRVPALPGSGPTRTVFVCRADRFRATVDDVAGQGLRYRSWDKPHALSDPADLTLTAGEMRFEGTGPCTHRVWTFKQPGASYSLEEFGCTDGSGGPDSIGTWSRSVREKPDDGGYCYR